MKMLGMKKLGVKKPGMKKLGMEMLGMKNLGVKQPVWKTGYKSEVMKYQGVKCYTPMSVTVWGQYGFRGRLLVETTEYWK